MAIALMFRFGRAVLQDADDRRQADDDDHDGLWLHHQDQALPPVAWP